MDWLFHSFGICGGAGIMVGWVWVLYCLKLFVGGYYGRKMGLPGQDEILANRFK